MLFNHLKVAFRRLTRNKALSILNILGLTLGLALVVLISVFIRDEFSKDIWMEDADLTYRAYRIGPHGETAWTPSPLAEKLSSDYPEVETAAAWAPNGDILVTYAGQDWYLDNTARIDSNFFDVVSMEFARGDKHTAMDGPNSIVISTELATLIFDDKDPLGEVLKVDGGRDYIIRGVLSDASKKSHITSDLFMRFRHYNNVWRYNSRSTYVRLRPSSNVAGLAAKVQDDLNELISQEYIANGVDPAKSKIYDWSFQPLSKVFLHSEGWTAQGEKGSIRFVYIFCVVALIILLVAIVNYVNLTTAQATERGREVAVRKVNGAGRGLLTVQFLTESVLLSLFAGGLALVVAELFLPVFNQIVDRNLELFSGRASMVVLGTLGLALFTGLAAGSYPAMILSRFKPSVALRSNFLHSGAKGSLRKILVVGQFAICLTLLIVMAFIYRQVNFMLSEELGFQPDQVLTIPINLSSTPENVTNLKTQFKQIPGVEDLTLASAFPGTQMPDWIMMEEGRPETLGPHVLFTDEDFANVLNIEVVAGRFIDDENAADDSTNFVVNEEFVERYNIADPIGAKIKWDSDEEYGQIVGVVKNFHFRGLSETMEPLVMNSDHWRSEVGIKIAAGSLGQAIPQIEELWALIEPGFPMRYTFLDDDFGAQYASYERFGKSILYATILTLFIALLGLFGLTIFTVRRRTKEIGIRKVLGASVAGIVGLLARDNIKLLTMSCLLAIPLGYYLSNQWLSDFAHRTTMDWWIFAGACAIILLLGFLTVSVQSARAALVNPMQSLQTD